MLNLIMTWLFYLFIYLQKKVIDSIGSPNWPSHWFTMILGESKQLSMVWSN